MLMHMAVYLLGLSAFSTQSASFIGDPMNLAVTSIMLVACHGWRHPQGEFQRCRGPKLVYAVVGKEGQSITDGGR